MMRMLITIALAFNIAAQVSLGNYGTAAGCFCIYLEYLRTA